MGADCSNCKCTNNEEEKILIIQDGDKNYKDTRKLKLESQANTNKESISLLKSKCELTQKERLDELFEYNPGLEYKLSRIAGLVKKYKARSIYLIVRNKIRVSWI